MVSPRTWLSLPWLLLACGGTQAAPLPQRTAGLAVSSATALPSGTAPPPATAPPSSEAGDGSVACTAPIDRAAGVAACVGNTVTLMGIPERSKQATLLGVDVAGDHDGETTCTATGVLERYTIQPREPGAPIVASRSAGTYLRLVDERTKVIVHPICKKKKK